MDTTQFMGLLIGAIVVLLSIATAITALIITPIIRLNKAITKLNDSIDQLNNDSARLEARVSKHGDRLDEHDKKLVKIDCDISSLKESR